MANPYGFTSSLGSAGNALQEFLLQREMQKRQAMLDALNKQQVEAQIASTAADDARADAGLALNREQFEYGRQRDVAEDTFRNDQARQAAADRASAAESQRTFQAEQNELNRQAAAERAQSERELRELIARMGASNSAESRELANRLREIQIQGVQDKLDTTRAERDKTESSARQSTQSALDAVDRLLDVKDVGGNIGAATGAYELRGFTQGAQDFNSVRDQLVAALTQPNLGALKGPMSDKDVAFVKQLATRLGNTRMSEAETRRALTEAQTFLRNKLGPSAPAGNANDYRSKYGY
jgi:hypothetical protein